MLPAAALVAAVLVGPPPAPTRWVTDEVGILSPAARDRLDARLEAFEQATGHQIVVWIGPTIGDEDLADWSVKTFAAWKLGRAKLDDGLALFIIADKHQLDLEVGYGLEGQITDAVSSHIIHDELAPKLRAGDADGAVTAAVDTILSTLGGATTPPARRRLPIPPVIPIIFGVLMLILFITHPRFALWMMWAIMSGGRGGGGGGGGGGFSGGGGRSGGGGARGSW